MDIRSTPATKPTMRLSKVLEKKQGIARPASPWAVSSSQPRPMRLRSPRKATKAGGGRTKEAISQQQDASGATTGEAGVRPGPAPSSTATSPLEVTAAAAEKQLVIDKVRMWTFQARQANTNTFFRSRATPVHWAPPDLLRGWWMRRMRLVNQPRGMTH